MSLDTLTEVTHEAPVQVNLDNDELIVIETLQYGVEPIEVGGGSSSNCNCNSCCNGSSEDPIG